MEGVSFNEESQARISTPRTSRIVGFVIRTGIARDERAATMVLIGIIVAAFVIAGGIWLFGGSSSELPLPR